MKKHMLVGAIIVVCVLLAACGGPTGSGKSSTSSPTATQLAPTLPNTPAPATPISAAPYLAPGAVGAASPTTATTAYPPPGANLKGLPNTGIKIYLPAIVDNNPVPTPTK